MSEIFTKYITDIIFMTFGFKPLVRVDTPNDGVYKVYLDGNEEQRKQMMGYHAQNFHALKQMLICFSKKYNVYVFLYLEFNEVNHPHNQIKTY